MKISLSGAVAGSEAKPGRVTNKRVKSSRPSPPAHGLAASSVQQETSPAVLALPAQATLKAPPVNLVLTRFVLPVPKERHVVLCGTFSGWSAIPMQWNDGGYWEASLQLAPGLYEYKFMMDREWIPDPLAPDYVFNTFGTLNSVVTVK